MWTTRCSLLLTALVAGSGQAQEPLAFENIHVVAMVGEEVLEDHVVVVRDAAIVAVGPRDEVVIPDDARRIDGEGKFLMPGLADMHVHLTARAELLLYVAHGVTTVRNMWGGPDTLELRDRVARGELLGPTIYTTGPILDGPEPRWPSSTILRNAANARAAVRSHQKLGYHALKVYDGLSAPVYRALMDRAREAGIPVVGHVPHAIGLDGALEAGQRSIEHLRGYWPELETDAEIVEAARATAEAGTWNCPTLVVHDLPFATLENLAAARRRPEVLLVPPAIVARWDPVTDGRFEGITEMTPAVRAAHATRMTQVRHIVGALHEAGAPLLLGTDTPNPFVVPGYSVHQELQQLVSSGLTPFEALRTATTNAAEFLERSDAGRVAVGAAADLLLVDHNPIEDISATQHIAGVVVRGRWMPRTELRHRLDELVASYRNQDWFAGMPELPGITTRYEVLWNDTEIGAVRVSKIDDGEGTQALHTQSVFTDRYEPRRMTAVRTVDERGQQLEVRVEDGERTRSVGVTKWADGLSVSYRTPTGISRGSEEIHTGGGQLGAGLLSHAVIFGPRCLHSPADRFEWTLRTPEFEEDFEVSMTHVVLVRSEDEELALGDRLVAARVFDMTLTTGDFTTRGELAVDLQGAPLSIRLIFPQGIKTIRQKR